MSTDQLAHMLYQTISDLTGHLGAVTFLIIAAVSLIAAYGLNRLIDLIVPRLAGLLSRQTERTSKTERLLQLRRAETFLSIGSAVTKTIIVFAAIFIAYKAAHPTSAPIAIIGASAFFVVLLGATIAPLLKDITTGVIMIVEQWYNVGDHIAVEPYGSLSGVVEQVTLRSTRLRSLTGEVIWLHNQYIQGVRVTPRGVRTIAIDVIVSDQELGKKLFEEVIPTLPKGATMVARELAIAETEQLSPSLWRIMATGQTTPGREWLIENFAVAAMTKNDAARKNGPVIVHGPIVHYADATAERRFKRSIRTRQT